jgi:deoxycytidylate deaminase/dephospho-CoA kinase
MANAGAGNLQIIGLTGSFGSGCTYAADHILVKLGFRKVSLSELLRDQYRASHVGEPGEISRRALQEFGDRVRREHGPSFLAELAHHEIFDAGQGISTKWVVDSIRNPAEVHYLRSQFPTFFLFGFYATKELRWERVRAKYNGNRREFDEDDERDTGRRSEEYGQRVEDCFAEADVVLSNDRQFAAVGNEPFAHFEGTVRGHVELVSAPLSRRQPTQMAALMAAAYTLSQRSSCLKRKVGAIIVDDEGNIISSGFNEVPTHYRPCAEEYTGECGRDVIWKNFAALLDKDFQQVEQHAAIAQAFRREFRRLDNCRALHAEENAIVNLARNGRSVPLERCTLYTTTYPCRLCANKIVNLGIQRVVYLEPYPDAEAKVIFQNGGVKDEFFEGVTFKAYSRIYGEKR